MWHLRHVLRKDADIEHGEGQRLAMKIKHKELTSRVPT
jgi:hypothetical protein